MSGMFLTKLGLGPDADERAVKRAYAALLKSRRPDDDAAGFQQLHQVYQAALSWVRSRDAAQATATEPASGFGPGPTLVARFDASKGEWPSARAAPAQEAPAGLKPPSEAVQAEAPFDARAFFDALLQVGQAPPAELQAWLQAHPALYSIQLRAQLVPSLVQALESADKLPAPDGLECLFDFFGLNHIDRSNLFLQPRLEQIRDLAFRQHQVLVGPDMSFMLEANGEPRRRPASSGGWPQVVPVLLILVCLSSLARCVGAPSRDGAFVIDPDALPATLPREQRPGADDPPWRYVPPVPVPPTPADADPD